MYIVSHKMFGDGNAEVNGDYISVNFKNVTKTFSFPDAFVRNFLFTADNNLITEINNRKFVAEQKEKEAETNLNNLLISIKEKSELKEKKSIRPKKESNSIIGSRAKDVKAKDKDSFYEILGYMCSPGRLRKIDAEVPDDDRATEFEMNFPNQPYYKINMNDETTKYNASFRIYLNNVDNCPLELRKEIRDDGPYYRLNKTGFIWKIVSDYGFQFGTKQDIEKIKNIAIEHGYENAFNAGYNR